MTEDWPVLMSFFPEDWLETAAATGVTTKLRKDKDVENYLRTLLIHLACGHSMRETVVRAKMAGLANISDVVAFSDLDTDVEKVTITNVTVASGLPTRLTSSVAHGFNRTTWAHRVDRHRRHHQ